MVQERKHLDAICASACVCLACKLPHNDDGCGAACVPACCSLLPPCPECTGQAAEDQGGRQAGWRQL